MIVLDSSAILAFLWDEPGTQIVAEALQSGDVVCTVANWAEVATKVMAAGGSWDDAEEALFGLRLAIVPLTADDAVAAGHLWLEHRNLSLGDRLCLAVAMRQKVQTLTADTEWAAVTPLVQLIRPAKGQ